MASNIKILDPVQGLVDYVNDIKPYHTKIIESLVEYVGHEALNVNISDNFHFGIELAYGRSAVNCQTYAAVNDTTTQIDVTIPLHTNIVVTGSPAYRTTNSFGTMVYKNGILQEEIYGSPETGNYYISAQNQITFTAPLSLGDVVEMCVVVLSSGMRPMCLDGGFDTLPFSDPFGMFILSPDPTKTPPEFPAWSTNSFIVLGDQRQIFDTNSNLAFKIISHIEDRIIGILDDVGSPQSDGFKVKGDKTNQFIAGYVFAVIGAVDNNGAYKTITSSYDGVATTIYVAGQIPSSNDVSGFIKTRTNNNNGSVVVVSSIFTKGSIAVHPHTTVFVTGLTLVPPSVASIGENQRYISRVVIAPIEYKKILSYSNALRYYNTSTFDSLLQTPDEGVVYAPIVNLSQGSPAYFMIEGNYESSNLFVGDAFTVVNSTDNNTEYTIESISYEHEPLVNAFVTKLGVASIHDDTIDGFVKLDIPSNAFIVDGDYTDFFKQGVRVNVLTGSKSGIYTTLNSKLVNGETQIRVHEDIIGHGRGRLVRSTVSGSLNGFVVDGDLSAIFKEDVQFNVVLSVRNDGAYTTSSDAVYNPTTHTTTIYIDEPFDSTDTTGELHEFTKGVLTHLQTGFAQTPELCEVVPETLVNVGIKDRLYIDNVGIWASDDIIAYGTNTDGWGYDLPPTTIFRDGSIGQPSVVISNTPPLSPVEDTIWFDTSSNSELLSAPGSLKQYSSLLAGSPSTGWVDVQNNKAYWIDTDTNYMYYRIVYQHYDNSISAYPSPNNINGLDTGWILEYTKIPGYNDLIFGRSSRRQIGFETFFVVRDELGTAVTTYNLSDLSITLTGSPALPDPTMLEVYVNSTIAAVTVLSPTSFMIVSPRLRVDDFIEVRVFDDGNIPTNTFLGSFNANAAITETFNLLKGYKFHIAGTTTTGSPQTGKIYITDNMAGTVFSLFMQGSPLVLTDTSIEITSSVASPSINGNYTILDATQESSPNTYVVLTVAESLMDTGIFSGSPLIESGKALYQQWFQYMIVNTTANTIVVFGDATGDIVQGSPLSTIRISHSSTAGSPLMDNNGIYSIASSPTYDGRNTTITTVETLTNLGNFGGWVESI